MKTIELPVTRRQLLTLLGVTSGMKLLPAWAADPEAIAPQPYFAGVNRALEALTKLGAPIAAQDAQRISVLVRDSTAAAVSEAEQILERYTLARTDIQADGYCRTTAGGAKRQLIEQGWEVFLVRVSNSRQSADKLNKTSGIWPPASALIGTLRAGSTGASLTGVPNTLNVAPYIAQNWLASQLYEGPPMGPTLSGFAVEYRVIQLYSRDRGKRESTFDFYTAIEQYAAFIATEKRRGVKLSFDCLPTQDVMLRVIDSDGRGCMAALTIKDKLDRVYPLQAMRLAPDMYFQPKIYRADGETVRLPDGEYTVESQRGPEYLRGTQTVAIKDGHRQIEVSLKRWIDPAQWGWYSGDTHIHAAGCAHYEHPTEGVSPETIIRQVRGEALAIGDVLSWGPGWYYQKQFFTGHTISPPATLEHPQLQAANNVSLQPQATPKDSESLLRYDVEVSGFPSSYCGHLVLLRLKEQDYPGTKLIEEWPSWNLPIHQWAREQGAVSGVAHCGLGMVVDSTALPNYEIPPMDSMGTQEAIMDVTHGVVDFLSGCNTHPVAELNAWYHLLNCGFRLAMVGETDYPCISGERPGVGRSYVRLDERPVDDVGYDAWVRNLQKGKLYCGDGRSHFLDFKVNGHRSGEEDITLKAEGEVGIEALVAAWLEPQLPEDIEAIKNNPWTGWHLENARIGITREVPVELLVNGVAVENRKLIADGKPRPIQFKTVVQCSSWIALRILPSSHTHPVFIQVGGKPIRASRRSAQWCRDCVDKLWEVESPFMRESERPAAAEAYDHARRVYDRIIGESDAA